MFRQLNIDSSSIARDMQVCLQQGDTFKNKYIGNISEFWVIVPSSGRSVSGAHSITHHTSHTIAPLQLIFDSVSVLVSIAVTMIKNDMERKGFISLTLSGNSPSLRKVRRGTQAE